MHFIMKEDFVQLLGFCYKSKSVFPTLSALLIQEILTLLFDDVFPTHFVNGDKIVFTKMATSPVLLIPFLCS